MALYGWRWGSRGAVASGSVEKPHKGSWRPILESEFDLAYSPLMELDYGKGRLIWCTLDLEDHAAEDEDPAALQLASQIVRYAQTAPLTPKASKTAYIGDDAGAKLLDELGLLYEKAAAIPAGAELVVVGTGNGPSDTSLNAFVQGGGKVVVLPRSGESLPLGGAQKKVDSFHGSLNVPDWPEARGLSESDLRWRSDAEAWLIASGGDVGADGLLARKVLGKGVLMYTPARPEPVRCRQQNLLPLHALAADPGVVPGAGQPRRAICGRQADLHGHPGERRHAAVGIRAGEAAQRLLQFGLPRRLHRGRRSVSVLQLVEADLGQQCLPSALRSSGA